MANKYVTIRRADGGKQRAMVLASGKLRFVKNSGGHAPRKATKKMAKRRKSTALAHKRRSHSPSRRHHAAPRRRRRSGGGSIASTHNILHIGGAALGLGYLLGPSSPMPTAVAYANKIPGAKTFGPAAAFGVAALGVDRFLWKNKWLKLAGVAGIVLAAAKVGEQGSQFRWVGGEDDVGGDFDDVGGDDDVEGEDNED